MPIGNLTSQFFANVYLNELDYFIKHKLKAKYYIRYVDDFVILHSNKKILEIYKDKINKYLNYLKLELHPNKSKIISLTKPINFVGFRIFYYYKLLKKFNRKNIQEKLNKFSTLLKKITKTLFVDKRVIEDLVKDLQRSLLAADVDVKLVFELTNKIKERALDEKPPKTISQKEYIIKIVYEELVDLLGKESSTIKIERKKPFKIMMVGLFGSGKTTTIAKLAKYYQKRNYKIATLGLDVHRPAAPEQLKQLSDKIKVQCFINTEEKNPIKIYKQFEKEFKNYDILIVDTAGRDALSEDLIEEIKSLKKEIQPDESVLVISADIGQAAKNQALAFKESCNVSSIIVSKMDGTAKAGGALTSASSTGAKVKFLAVGEKPEDLEVYIPERFVSRLLGMGDLETLLEKAKEAISEEEAKDLGKKFLKGEFNLIEIFSLSL